MKRRHLFEFHDLDWFPHAWRVLLTDQLDFFAETFHPYRPVAPKLKAVLEKLACRKLVDLCAGGGGPVLEIRRELKRLGAAVAVTLTDKFPNLAAFHEARLRWGDWVRGVEAPVDATNVPSELEGFRTLFTSFHHFPPEIARRILADAVAKREGIGVFEYTERSWVWFASLPFFPLYTWLTTPFLRPFAWKRLLWTYVLPVVPLVMCWDGLVSCLRTYSPQELQQLTADIRASGYTWEIGRVRSFGACRVTYLLGYPTPRSAGA